MFKLIRMYIVFASFIYITNCAAILCLCFSLYSNVVLLSFSFLIDMDKTNTLNMMDYFSVMNEYLFKCVPSELPPGDK